MIRQPIQLVLFDLGSTLFHVNGPWEALYREADAALWRALRRAGVTSAPRDLYGGADTLFELYNGLAVEDLREPGMTAVLERLLRSKGFQLDAATLRSGLGAMYAVTQTNWLPEEDARLTLERLKKDGLRIGAVTNGADDDNTQSLIDKCGVRPYLEHIVSSAAFGRRKPHPAIFEAALAHFGVDPAEAVMVGDDPEADIVGAHDAGMQAIWITRRVGKPLPQVRRGEPEAVVAALDEIPALLERV